MLAWWRGPSFGSLFVVEIASKDIVIHNIVIVSRDLAVESRRGVWYPYQGPQVTASFSRPAGLGCGLFELTKHFYGCPVAVPGC